MIKVIAEMAIIVNSLMDPRSYDQRPTSLRRLCVWNGNVGIAKEETSVGLHMVSMSLDPNPLTDTKDLSDRNLIIIQIIRIINNTEIEVKVFSKTKWTTTPRCNNKYNKCP